MKRLSSEEDRINYEPKPLALHELMNRVFADRVDSPHWNLDSVIETRAQRRRLASATISDPFTGAGNSPDDSESSAQDAIGSDGSDVARAGRVHGHKRNDNGSSGLCVTPSNSEYIEHQVLEKLDFDDHSETQAGVYGSLVAQARSTESQKKTPAPTSSTKVNYEIGHFVVVKLADASGSTNNSVTKAGDIGIGKILSVDKADGESFVRKLRIHWFDEDKKTKANNFASVKFFPCYTQEVRHQDKRRKTTSLSHKSKATEAEVPWIDEVDTDTVLVTFKSLEKNNTLPINVLNKVAI